MDDIGAHRAVGHDDAAAEEVGEGFDGGHPGMITIVCAGSH